MKLTKRYADIISLFGMIILLAAAYFSDNLVYELRRIFLPNTHQLLLYLWLVPILSLVLAICLLILFQFTVFQEKRNILISVLFIVVGICSTFYTTLHYGLGWGPSIPLFMNWAGYGRLFFFVTSTLVTAIGVLSLVLPKQRKNGVTNVNIEKQAEAGPGGQ